MKKLYSLSLSCLLASLATAQVIDTNWVNRFDRQSSTAKVQVADLPNGDYLLARFDKYYHMSSEGDSLDAVVENTNFGSTRDLAGVGDGALLAGAFNGHPAVAKMDTNFNITWVTELSAGSGEAAALYVDGSDYYTSGYSGFSSDFIARFDANGDTAWMLELPQSTFTQLSSIIKLSDGNFLASGNLDDYPLAVKFNASGDTLWTYYEPIFISFQKMSAFERSNGEIVLVGERHFVELDASGNKLSDGNFTIHQFYDLKVDGDTVYLFGHQKDTVFGSERKPLVEVRNTDMDSLGSFTYEENIDLVADNEFADAIRTPGGGYIAVGKVRASGGNNTYDLLAMKFNDAGIVGLPVAPTAGAGVSVYPNPAADRLILESGNALGRVDLLDLEGRRVRSLQCTGSRALLDVQDLEAGVYLLRFANGSAPQRFVKR